MDGQFAQHYLEDMLETFRAQRRMAERAAEQLDDDQFFRTLDPESNSVAVIMKHMGGNLRSRWTDFLTTDGEKPDRDRDSEFEIGPDDSRERVLTRWEEGWRCLEESLRSLAPADLAHTVRIRGEPHTVPQALHRSLSHAAQHTGQVILLAKHLRGADWRTLSIPRGQSAAYNARMKQQKA